MSYRPNMEASRPGKAIVQARQWGVGVITASAGVGMLLSEIERVKSTIADPLTVGYLALFAVTGAVIFLWIWATSKELDLCFQWLDPERYAPPSSVKETLMIAGLGLLLSALLFAARDPLYYAGVFTAYSAVVTYAYRYTRAEIAEAISASRHRLDGEANGESGVLATQYRKGVDVLDIYFCARPQTARHVIILLLSVGALLAALFWKLTGQTMFGVLAYALVGGAIVVSEVVIAQWRMSRDGLLRPLEAEIAELARADLKNVS